MTDRTVHLICNSHLDPVWLWEWPEGVAEALAMARTGADLCEEFDGFVFNRNEAMFYEWIEEYDPPLFERVRRLVQTGRWHVMGGWYLQPDCNMPSGESFVRQILVGQRYFQDKLGVRPTTAANLDPFGHSRGLVQILARSGYDSYLYCRPTLADRRVPDTEFVWVGFDGSELTAALAAAHYNCPPGGGRAKIEKWMARLDHKPVCVIPWGVGNHGGGPSRRDVRELAGLIDQDNGVRLMHSTPEDYFRELRDGHNNLPRHERDLNPWAVGCYTTMARVKRRHRRLENELYATEKMVTTAACQGLLPYPRHELREATRDLLVSEFHDALPGTSIQPVEEATVQLLDHGLEILSRVRTRAFFALAAGQRPGRAGEFPILVFNPHPFRVAATVGCELQPAWPHRTEQFASPRVRHRGREIPCQAEKAHCNINEDHRKEVVFDAVLEPCQMNRFDCRLAMVSRRPRPKLRQRNERIRFRTDALDVIINARTGLLDRYRVGGTDFLAPGACQPLVMRDDADPWGMTVTRFRTRVGRFRLMSRAEGCAFSGVEGGSLPSVRIIEDGPVRSVVEAVLGYRRSAICLRYKLPRRGTELEIETHVLWNEKDRMLKLSLPTPMTDATYRGQAAYGVTDLPTGGDEAVAQKWVAVVSRECNMALTCVNDATYGSDLANGELRLSLLRAPAHAGHPTGEGRPIVRQDRYTPRIDQGERSFRFWLNGGPVDDRLSQVDREALLHNERPIALTCYPSGEGSRPKAGVRLSDAVVQVTAFKQAEEGEELIIRLFEPTGRPRTTTLSLPFVPASTRVRLAAFEIKTLRFDRRTKRFTAVDLLEEPLPKQR